MGRVSIIFNNKEYPVSYEESGIIRNLKTYIAVWGGFAVVTRRIKFT